MIIYICGPQDLSKSVGVFNKIIGQIKTLKSELNSEKCELLYLHESSVLSLVFKGNDEEPHKSEIYVSNPTVTKLTYYKHIYNYLVNKNADKDPQNFLFFRGGVFDPYLVKILDWAKSKHYIIIMEIPTSSFIDEYLKDNSRIKGLYKLYMYKRNARKILDRTDLVTCVGHVPKYKDFLSRIDKVIVFQNGIDVENIPVRTVNTKDKSVDELHLVGVANVTYWHGYDRVITGLAQYYSKKNNDSIPKVYFHIVGDGREIKHLKSLTEQLNISQYVIFHGIKQGKELDEIMNICHVGIGSIGIHRKNLSINSELKAIEYCARGVPFIATGTDEDFPPDFRYRLQISADESPVNIEEVIRFYETIRNENYINSMRKYAEENLSWQVKLKPIVAKLLEICKQ